MSQAAEQFEHTLASAARALAGDPSLEFELLERENQTNNVPSWVPAPAQTTPDKLLAVMRGNYDAVAMQARFHVQELHHINVPAGPLSFAVFTELEKLRIEACAARDFKGVAANLAAAFEYRFSVRGVNIIDSDAVTSMSNALVLMLRGRLIGTQQDLVAERFIARWQDEINTRAGPEIEALCNVALDQAEFAACARRCIKALELVDDPEQSSQIKPAEAAPDESADEAGIDPPSGAGNHGDNEAQTEASAAFTAADTVDEDVEPATIEQRDREHEADVADNGIAFALGLDKDPVTSPDDALEGVADAPDENFAANTGPVSYRAFTTQYDAVVNARDILDKTQLLHYRARLDQEIASHRQIVVKLANRLQNSLRTLQKRSWTFDLDDGLLDTTQLPRLVIDPTSPLAYKQERESETRDTVVSFLIDNSGSMRGQPITLAAMFTDILAQALERCQVATEILGFTTGDWRGGRTCQYWQEQGRPAKPGRLSDLHHIIYKHADKPWRKARQSLGVMLWPGLLKENIDGEALLWAHRRLTGRREQRRILMVISDGVPADDATVSVNDGDFLTSHLRQVVERIETRSGVELLAIGIGHDVGSIYRRSVTIEDTGQLGNAMAYELIELLGSVPLGARHPFVSKTIAGQTL